MYLYLFFTIHFMAKKSTSTTPEVTTTPEEFIGTISVDENWNPITPTMPAMDASLLVEALRESTKSFPLASQINTNLNEIERLMLVK